jgi:hypothetical protein
MTVLLEGVSLIFANKVLEERYPGGILAFRSTWDNGSFCTDGSVSRLSFFESGDAFCTLMAMPDYGLEVSSRFAIDVAVFLHGGSPWVPCLWLETSYTNQGMRICWHCNEDKGERFAVPQYYRAHTTLARYGNLAEVDFMIKVKRVGEKNGVSLFRDQLTNRIFAGPNPLRRH